MKWKPIVPVRPDEPFTLDPLGGMPFDYVLYGEDAIAAAPETDPTAKSFAGFLEKARQGPVQRPGSRGGKGYYDDQGKWQYGERPAPKKRRRRKRGEKEAPLTQVRAEVTPDGRRNYIVPRSAVERGPLPLHKPAPVEEVAAGSIPRAQREAILQARLQEMGVELGRTAQSVEPMPESQVYLGKWTDMAGKPHYVKMPTGRSKGRPRKDESAPRPAPPPGGASAEQVPPGLVREYEAEGRTIRVYADAAGRQNYRDRLVRENEREFLAERWLESISRPDPVLPPTPQHNLQHIMPALPWPHLQADITRRCDELAAAIWQRQGSPVRFQVVQPWPERRPEARRLVAVYQEPGSEGEVIVPVLQGEWASRDPLPPPLGQANDGRAYGRAALRLIKRDPTTAEIFYQAAGLAPVFSVEYNDLLTRAARGQGLTVRQAVAMAIGLAGVAQQLEWEYWQADATGDDDRKMMAVLQRGALYRAALAWGRADFSKDLRRVVWGHLPNEQRGQP